MVTARGKVTKKILKYIKKNIQNGTWQVGEKIPSENTLCQELDVSRVSVRNALQQFVSVGVLDVQHGKGTYLISNDLSAYEPSSEYKEYREHSSEDESMDELKQILEFRTMVEPSIAEKVAKTASPEFVERLSSLFNVMRANVGNTRTFVEADMQFHLEICSECGNPYMISVMKDVFAKKADSANLLNLGNGFYGGIYYHSLLIDAFKKHDSKRARSVMLEHLEHGFNEFDDDTSTSDEDIE